jgi:hypothetical protein
VVLLLLNLGVAQPLQFLLLSLRLKVCAVVTCLTCEHPIGLLKGLIKYICRYEKQQKNTNRLLQRGSTRFLRVRVIELLNV